MAMATARRRHDWHQTAELLTMLFNVNCGSKQDAITTPWKFMPPDLRPRRQRRQVQPLTAKDRELLKKVFPGGKGKRKR